MNSKLFMALALQWTFVGAIAQSPPDERVAPEVALKEEVDDLLFEDIFNPKADEALRLVELAGDEIDLNSRRELVRKIAARYSTMGFYWDAIGLYERIADELGDGLSDDYRRYLRQLIALCFEDAGLREQAVHVWEDLRRDGALHPRESVRLARLCSELGRFDEADRYFEEIGPWSLESYTAESKKASGDAWRWVCQAEHFMRTGRWEDALSYWQLNPQVGHSFGAASAPSATAVQVGYNQSLCLRALGRHQEAVDVLTRAIHLGNVSGVSVACAKLYVEIVGERWDRSDVAGLKPGDQMFQVMQGVGSAVAKTRSGDLEGFATILAIGPEGLTDDDAIRATRRVANELIMESGVTMHEALRQHVGRDYDLYACVALAGMGDATVIGRVREFVSEGERQFGLEDRLKLLTALGTDEAYDLLEVFARSEDESLREHASSLLRRHPRVWPAPSVSSLFFPTRRASTKF